MKNSRWNKGRQKADRKSDGVHWHLVRCIGGQIIAAGFVILRFRDAGRVTHTVCYLLLIYHLFNAYISMPIHQSTFNFAFGTTLLPGNKIGNCLYQLDAIASICIGCAWLTFPKWLLHRQVTVPLDLSHELCGRIMGGLFVSSYAVSAHALHWTNTDDKMVAVDGRVVCCLCILSAQVWSQIAYIDSWSGGHWVGITLFSTWTLSSILYRLSLHFIFRKKAKKS
ncbi:hypothetical protein DICVIV_09753 [Dictyocaulus viviparus]|uniref:Uncharacterized protein n=1 Tax=Dictyocaulus viviparus TaxID=29172 RepID=A0A0D8XKI0_DICVI|nr:hypothetical protein DICVIV_09753 [Dictyocaulus viviparus]